MPVVRVDAAAVRAIKALLAEAGAAGPLRIELRSTGCCDSSLGLRVHAARQSDTVEEVDGLTFVIDQDTLGLVGEVHVSYVEEPGRNGFVLTASNPVSEWEGFAPTSITT